MSPGTVLVIEDDAGTRYAMRRTLEGAGYTVHAASDGTYGLEWLRNHSSQPCLVLLDLHLPQLNGWQFLVRCQSDPALRQAPVVVVTGAIASGEKLIGIQPAAILHKPVSAEALLAAVAEHLPAG